MNELFFTSNEDQRYKGYCEIGDHYHCLLCDFVTEKGYVYPVGEAFVDAKKQMELHIKESHISVVDHLLTLDKKMNGLSEHQGKILKMFYDGLTDYEIQKDLNIGSISTIRNHRHLMKEKEKQAKILVTLMGLLAEKTNSKTEKVMPHSTAKMVDLRYDVTIDESMKVLNKYFPSGIDGPLSTFYVKEKYKIIILRAIIKRFEAKKRYSEKEVDIILKEVYLDDYVLIRRYMIQYGFMDREKDGSFYWVNEKKNLEDTHINKKEKKGKKVNDKKKALKQAYMAKIASEDVEDGIYQIKNRVNNKVYIGSSKDISKLNGLAFQLNMGTFMNKVLQKDWNELGEDNFSIEVLESFKRQKNSDNAKTLRDLLKKWKDKLEPYGNKGYHRDKRK